MTLDLRQPVIAPVVPVTSTARQHRKLVAAPLPTPKMTRRRVQMPTLLPLRRKALRVSSTASQLPGFTSLRFALHGCSGKLLDSAFERAGILKRDIYITNVVKCHPPGNRTSYEKEIENCIPFLKQELEWIKPQHIICLGKDAWAYFNSHVTKPSYKEVKLNGTRAIIHYLYHPSYIRRKSKDEQSLYIDSIAEILSSKNA